MKRRGTLLALLLPLILVSTSCKIGGSSTSAPGAFSITSAAAGNSQVVLTWGASQGATSYTIAYGTSSGSYGTAFSASSPATVTGLTNGTTYYFLVTAFNSGGSTAASAEASATPGAAPGAFTISTPTPGAGDVTLTWSTASGVSSYTVKYGTSSGSYGTTFSTTATSPTTVTGLTYGTTYYFMVTAVNAIGSTNATAAVSASPLGGMNCYTGSIGNQGEAYQVFNDTTNFPISSVASLSGTHITNVAFPLYLQDPNNADIDGTAYVGTITLKVYSCVTPGSAPSTGTLLGSAAATYANEVGSTFSLSTIGAGTQGDLTEFSFSASPLAIPTNCNPGQQILAFEFASMSGFASEWVMAPSLPEAGYSNCFLEVSSSATNVSPNGFNSYQAIITAQ